MGQLERSFFANSWVQSFGLHFGIFLLILTLQLFSSLSLRKKTTIDFEVLQFPVQSQMLQLEKPPELAKPQTSPQSREVFGANRNSMTASDSVKDAIEIKAGNTVAKDQDNLKLNENDLDKLPIPTDEFLVTAMPALVGDFRVPYPEEAKKAGVQGPVVMDLLIDTEGNVRQVQVLTGPGYGLNDAAAEAAKKFKFRPARVSQEPVAVKIRYTYNFVLEER